MVCNTLNLGYKKLVSNHVLKLNFMQMKYRLFLKGLNIFGSEEFQVLFFFILACWLPSLPVDALSALFFTNARVYYGLQHFSH